MFLLLSVALFITTCTSAAEPELVVKNRIVFNFYSNFYAVLWIRIQFGSVFSTVVTL